MGLDPEISGSTIRVSFGPNTDEQDVDRFLTEWRRIKSRVAAA